LYLDNTAFAQDQNISGLSNSRNPYDALNGALVVNFNSLFIGKGQDGQVFSAEKVTPLTPLARAKAQLLVPGIEERINLTNHPSESLLYAGELFSAFFESNGIRVDSRQISETAVDNSWQLIYTHRNRNSLKEIIEGLFRYSNNYIANQIFLIVGLQHLSTPATLEKSRLTFYQYIRKRFGESFAGAVIDEASGISKKNRLSCRNIMQILEAFKKHGNLLHVKNSVRIKSGTLTGIYNYAGYFETRRGLQPFVIMTDQPQNNRDRILNLLNRYRQLKNKHKIEN